MWLPCDSFYGPKSLLSVWLRTIITPMASDPFLSWANRTVLRPHRDEPYLCIQDIVVFVRDLEVSKRFYVDQLGFELDHRTVPSHRRPLDRSGASRRQRQSCAG
jgi:hypothetical protein